MTDFCPYKLPQYVREVLIALTDSLLEEPADLKIHNRNEEFIERCEIFLFEMQPFLRWGFVVSLWFFNVLAMLWRLEFCRFVNMELEERRHFVNFWLHTQNPLLREFFKALRTLIMIIYFSHHDVWRYIGYDPRAHVEDRLQLRASLLKRDRPQAANTFVENKNP